jgi:hypothetical protein
MKMYERVEVQLLHYIPRHYMEMSGQIHAPAALTPEKRPSIHIG